MANFVTPALLFGVILLVASVGLFLFGRIKPELQRDSDNVYAIVGMVCSLILLANFNLGLGMSFQQLLMIGALLTLMWENIQNRQPKAPSTRRGSFDDMRDGMRQWGDSRRGRPSLENERAASNIYRYEAEYNDYDRFDAPRRQEQRRIRGSEPRRGYDDEFGDDTRRGRPPGRTPQASLNEADNRRGYDGFDDRASGRGPSSRPPRNDDWDDAPRRGRNGTRDAAPTDARRPRGRGPQDFDARPQEDMPPPRRRPRSGSMDGSPIPPEFQEQPSGRPGPNGPNPSAGSRPSMGRPSTPPSDRPPPQCSAQWSYPHGPASH